MGYSPRYHIWDSETAAMSPGMANHHSETDSLECIERAKRRCKECGDYYGYILDTHTGEKEKFGEWPASQPTKENK